MTATKQPLPPEVIGAKNPDEYPTFKWDPATDAIQVSNFMVTMHGGAYEGPWQFLEAIGRLVLRKRDELKGCMTMRDPESLVPAEAYLPVGGCLRVEGGPPAGQLLLADHRTEEQRELAQVHERTQTMDAVVEHLKRRRSAQAIIAAALEGKNLQYVVASLTSTLGVEDVERLATVLAEDGRTW